MATPHVSGSAAILLQEHPTWTAVEFKEALMGSALRNAALDPFQQGAGRVDVAHEIVQTVLADPPSVSFATEAYPHTDDTPDVRTVTYQNTSTSPVTLQTEPRRLGADLDVHAVHVVGCRAGER